MNLQFKHEMSDELKSIHEEYINDNRRKKLIKRQVELLNGSIPTVQVIINPDDEYRVEYKFPCHVQNELMSISGLLKDIEREYTNRLMNVHNSLVKG